MSKALQDEHDALVELGQAGVHVVQRCQAFKDTGWDPTEACNTDRDGHLYFLDPSRGEGELHHRLTCDWGCEHVPKLVFESYDAEIRMLEEHLDLQWDSEDILPYSTQILRSRDGRECSLLTEFYTGAWNTRGDVDKCRWIVFPSEEELDRFLLAEHKLRMPFDDRDHSALLLKWSMDNRAFWDSVYQFHQTPKACGESECLYTSREWG